MTETTVGSAQTGSPSRTSSTRALVEGDGSVIPARLRIVAWIVVATGVVLVAVVLTIRSSVLTDVERDSNASVTQEIDEFRTFVAEGRDPDDGQEFASASRLLQLYLQRQFPGRGEVLAGYDLTIEDDDAAPIFQDVTDDYGFTADDDDIEELATGAADSGSGELDGQQYRWGRAVVLDAAGQPEGVFVVVEFLEPAQDDADDIVRLAVLVCLGGLVLTGLIAFAVAGTILAPVRAVRRAAATITRTDLDRRIEVRGRDDVAALASTFNAMLDRLESSYRAQHRFVRVADHHVRARLQPLAEDTATAEERREAIDRIGATLDDMALLTASQLPGFAQLDARDLGDVTARLVASVEEATPTTRWVTQVDVAGTAELDLTLLTRAVGALAVNAAAEHRGEAPLRLGAAADDDSWEVWVEDDGPGLEEARAQHVLDRFTDLDAEIDPGPDSGLGLAVVRAVADAHEGAAWVESAPGAGARFGLRLPRVPRGVPDPDEEAGA